MQNRRIQMNLQFFAKTDPTQNQDPDTSGKEGEQELSIEEKYDQLLAQNAQLQNDNEKLKREKDTASTDAANWKKKYNTTLTDAQRAAQEKAENDAKEAERVKGMEKRLYIMEMSKNFLKLGYPEDKAEEAAKAQHEGDTDTLFRIQSEVQQNLIKQKETEWLKSRPQVQTGAGDKGDEDAFLKGFTGDGFYGRK